MKSGLLFLIITLLPINVLAHGLTPQLDVQAGVLPGEVGYFFDRTAEWVELNIFTPGTKDKQAKRLQFAEERLAEFENLLGTGIVRTSLLQRTAQRYAKLLMSSQDMAEKIIFLDGAEIAIAEKFEVRTRLHEQFISELLDAATPDLKSLVQKILTDARDQNQEIFQFLVEKYQFDQNDIQKHRLIVLEHMAIVRTYMREREEQRPDIEVYLSEAKKFLDFGLNIQAYEQVDQAKNLIY